MAIELVPLAARLPLKLHVTAPTGSLAGPAGRQIQFVPVALVRSIPAGMASLTVAVVTGVVPLLVTVIM
jgi:hypothetical protein